VTCLGRKNVPTTSSKIGTCNEKAVAYLLPFIEEEKAGGGVRVQVKFC
jgi:hypothetical protein